MGYYNESILLGFHQSSIRLQIGAGICAVPTTGTVATGKGNGYSCILPFPTLPNFTETISRGGFDPVLASMLKRNLNIFLFYDICIGLSHGVWLIEAVLFRVDQTLFY